MNWLSGKKTYILAAIGAVALAGQMLGWWTVPDAVWEFLGIGGAITIRAAIAKSGPNGGAK